MLSGLVEKRLESRGGIVVQLDEALIAELRV